jgi:hypothetical protein
MVFSVIYVEPGLSPGEHRRAVDAGPPFVETETEYPALLADTGWKICDECDMTEEFATAILQKLQAEKEQRDELECLIGAADFTDLHKSLESRYQAAADRILHRSLFVTVPV